MLACTLYARSGRLADPIYVHAKVGIIDDAWLTLGSANLNEHSLFNDTEMNVVAHDPELAAEPGCVSGPSISSCRSIRSRPIRSGRSTSSGSRSARISSTAPTRPAAHPSARTTAACLEPLRPRARAADGLLVDG